MPASGSQNPYQAPVSGPDPLPPKKPGEQFAPCPQCRQSGATRVGWTFWGGAVGPWLFTHVKCGNCGTKFNGKTGKSNTTAIAIYTVVSLIIVGVVVVAIRMSGP